MDASAFIDRILTEDRQDTVKQRQPRLADAGRPDEEHAEVLRNPLRVG